MTNSDLIYIVYIDIDWYEQNYCDKINWNVD